MSRKAALLIFVDNPDIKLFSNVNYYLLLLMKGCHFGIIIMIGTGRLFYPHPCG